MTKTIAIASGKGGVGKTWFSISLSYFLAKMGKKTLLFDGDLGLANVDIQLGLIPPYDLSSFYRLEKPLEDIIYHNAQLGFDIIPGGSGNKNISNMEAAVVAKLMTGIETLKKNYDYIIIDLSAGVYESIIQFSNFADQTIIVTNSEPTSLTDAYAFIKYKVASQSKKNINILVNMVENAKEGDITYNKLQKACLSFLKISVSYLGSIKRDLRVRDSIKNQSLIAIRYPNSDAVQDLQKIVTQITKQCYELVD